MSLLLPLGPYLALSTPTHVSMLVCIQHKADFPPQQTRANRLRLERRVPVQMILGAILVIQKALGSLTEKIPGLNALVDSAVGVAILMSHRSELQHKLTITLSIHSTNMQMISLMKYYVD